ncbi:MAG: 2-dehydro-3-deoxyphosphooctonate aldolase [Bacteroidota bacterium]|nr:2-dehydro-3-deoxyphosphooctonate aldolase [Bacteroidota bacterium]
MNYNEIISSKTFFLIAGPCVVESKDVCFEVAEQLTAITAELSIPLIFKASYKKANRSKLDSFTGIGDDEALQVLAEVRSHFNIPVITDIHETFDAAKVNDFVDALQIPAFLCRQTDLLIAAGETGKPVNIKKGQFVNADMMKFAVEKVLSTGNKNIFLTERGSMFGYNDIIVDYRNIPLMQQTGFPVVMDVTHAVQQPNSSAGTSGGQPQFIETLAKCAIGAGANGIFLETHPDPTKALSDGANMLQLDKVKSLLEKLARLKEVL